MVKTIELVIYRKENTAAGRLIFRDKAQRVGIDKLF